MSLNPNEMPNNELELSLDLDVAVKQMEALEEAKKNAKLSDMVKALKNANESGEMRSEQGEGSFVRLQREDDASVIDRIAKGESKAEKMEVIFMPETSSPLSFNDAAKYCKEMGGRLPTRDELDHVYKERLLGNHDYDDFLNVSYWTSEEGSETTAFAFNMKTGSSGEKMKSEAVHVARAVKKEGKVYSDGNETKQ